MSSARLDPITFEVIKNALSSAADEMALIVMRSAYSPVVRDTMDYSTALCDRRGQLIAQGLTLAVQLGSFPDGSPNRDGLASWAGTSFAAPRISGSIAALMSAGHTFAEAVAKLRGIVHTPQANAVGEIV